MEHENDGFNETIHRNSPEKKQILGSNLVISRKKVIRSKPVVISVFSFFAVVIAASVIAAIAFTTTANKSKKPEIEMVNAIFYSDNDQVAQSILSTPVEKRTQGQNDYLEAKTSELKRKIEDDLRMRSPDVVQVEVRIHYELTSARRKRENNQNVTANAYYQMVCDLTYYYSDKSSLKNIQEKAQEVKAELQKAYNNTELLGGTVTIDFENGYKIKTTVCELDQEKNRCEMCVLELNENAFNSSCQMVLETSAGQGVTDADGCEPDDDESQENDDSEEDSEELESTECEHNSQSNESTSGTATSMSNSTCESEETTDDSANTTSEEITDTTDCEDTTQMTETQTTTTASETPQTTTTITTTVTTSEETTASSESTTPPCECESSEESRETKETENSSTTVEDAECDGGFSSESNESNSESSSVESTASAAKQTQDETDETYNIISNEKPDTSDCDDTTPD